MLLSAPCPVPCSKVSWNSRPRRKAASESQLLFALIQRKETLPSSSQFFHSATALARKIQAHRNLVFWGVFVTCKILLMVFADVDSMCSELHIFSKPQ